MKKNKSGQPAAEPPVTPPATGEHQQQESAAWQEPADTPGMDARAGEPLGSDAGGSPVEERTEDPAESLLVTELKSQVEVLQDQLLRTVAEYDNYRKRTLREQTARYDEALADGISRFLPLVDNLERGVLAAQGQVNAAGQEILDGLQLIHRQAQEILQSLGVETIPALGETFDPNLHHAVLSIEDEQYGEQEIVEVFEKGYRREGRVLRHAVVKVAN